MIIYQSLRDYKLEVTSYKTIIEHRLDNMLINKENIRNWIQNITKKISDNLDELELYIQNGFYINAESDNLVLDKLMNLITDRYNDTIFPFKAISASEFEAIQQRIDTLEFTKKCCGDDEMDVFYKNEILARLQDMIASIKTGDYVKLRLTLDQARVLKSALESSFTQKSVLSAMQIVAPIIKVRPVSCENVQEVVKKLDLENHKRNNSIYEYYNDMNTMMQAIILTYTEQLDKCGEYKKIINKNLNILDESYGPASKKLSDNVMQYIDEKQYSLIKQANKHKSNLIDNAGPIVKQVYKYAMKGLEKS